MNFCRVTEQGRLTLRHGNYMNVSIVLNFSSFTIRCNFNCFVPQLLLIPPFSDCITILAEISYVNQRAHVIHSVSATRYLSHFVVLILKTKRLAIILIHHICLLICIHLSVFIYDVSRLNLILCAHIGCNQ